MSGEEQKKEGSGVWVSSVLLQDVQVAVTVWRWRRRRSCHEQPEDVSLEVTELIFLRMLTE